jgi:hypothetical protein
MGNVVDKEGKGLRTVVAFHPGELLFEEVEERSLKKQNLQRYRLVRGNLSGLFKGKRHSNILGLI